jgi:hypothetical protein
VDVGTAITSAFSAGISMYGVLALLGIAGRLDWIEGPELLQRPAVIVVLLVLFVVELVVDKIAFLDSAWDAVHTVLRPAAGAAIMAIAPDQTLPVPVALAIGGALALTSHSAKAATRALVNTSPEPVSNVVVSTAEDGLVAVLMALAIANPEVAAAITAVLVVLALGVILAARHAVRSLRRRWKARKAEKRSGDGPSPPGAGPPRR